MCKIIIPGKRKGLKVPAKYSIKKLTLILGAFILVLSLWFSLPRQVYAITLKELGNSVAKLESDEESLIEEIIASETEVENKRRKDI